MLEVGVGVERHDGSKYFLVGDTAVLVGIFDKSRGEVELILENGASVQQLSPVVFQQPLQLPQVPNIIYLRIVPPT